MPTWFLRENQILIVYSDAYSYTYIEIPIWSALVINYIAKLHSNLNFILKFPLLFIYRVIWCIHLSSGQVMKRERTKIKCLPYCAIVKAASPNHAGGPTIIVTIILVLVTRKPWNTKQPWLIRWSIDRISVRYYPTTVITTLSSHAAATRRAGKRIEKRSIDVTYPAWSLIEKLQPCAQVLEKIRTTES